MTGYELPEPWTVKFMVKMRNMPNAYKVKDFVENFVDVGEASRNMDEIIENISIIPNIDRRLRGIITIFKNGILPLYEDERNTRGLIVRFSLIKNVEQQKKIIAELEKNDDEKQKRKLTCVVEKCENLVHYFIFLTLSGILNPSEGNGQLNGIYIHTENDIIKVDLWYDSQVKKNGEKELVLSRICNLLKTIDAQTQYTYNNFTKSLSDSLQTIDMKEYNKPSVRGTS